MPSADFEDRIGALDLSLFAAIDSQSDDGDKRSWLALQRIARQWSEPYTYLEIGSHLGGSIQPHLVDPRCGRIYSIDKRPVEPPDDRGEVFRYEGNSTERMLSNLRAIDPNQVSKIVCFDSDTRELEPSSLPDRPDLCFIDGEHTRGAVLSDFAFCAKVCSPRAIICFHDDWIIYPALSRILRTLRNQGTAFSAFKLLGSTFALALGTLSVPEDDFLQEHAIDGRQFIRRMRARRLLKRSIPAPLLPIARYFRRLFAGANRNQGSLSSREQPAAEAKVALTLGAVVTNFDSWPLAARCIAALRTWSGRLERIVLIDDHSPGSPETLPADPRLAVRVNAARRGFAATLNRAIEELGTDIAVVFDADAYPLADASQGILTAFAGEPGLGLLGFRTVDAKGNDSPSWSAEPGVFALVAGQRLDGWLRRLRPARQQEEICLHTAALAVRREAFLALGGVDEELGFLDVDLDLSMRARRGGWIVRWDPSLVAYHEGGGTRVATRWRVAEFHRSRFRLLRKYGRIRFPGLLRALVLARLRLESLILASLGGMVFRDADRRRDKVLGRRELIQLVRREFR